MTAPKDALVALADEMERDAKWPDGRYVQDAASGADLSRWAERLRELAASAPEQAVDFDAWMQNPYTRVLHESIVRDYVPRADTTHRPADAAESKGDTPQHGGDAVATCKWTFDDDEFASMWNTACGAAWSFVEGGVAENGARFCQSCGKPVHALTADQEAR